MVRFLILVFIILIHPAHAASLEEFYILPMGQGNAQLVIYTQGSRKIGVLYDLGSKSLQTHPKFMSRGRWEKKYKSALQIGKPRLNSLVLTPAKVNPQTEAHEFQTPEPVKGALAPLPQQALTIDAKLNSSQRDFHKENLEDFILNLLQDLSHLFIFISHSDEDHICYLNQRTIPSAVPLTILFGGDWFGNVGCRNEETNVTKNVKDILKFLNARLQPNHAPMEFNFTYYQDFKIDERTNFNTFIKEQLQASADIESVVEQLKNLCSRDNLDLPAPVAPSFYSGNFRSLYSTLFPHQGSKTETASAEPNFMDQVKERIYIWSMNHLTDDINGQSIVISCTMPSLDMSVILTGDAQHSTFQHIYTTYNERGNFRSLSGFSPDHIVLFMLPHHGSRDNSSAAGLMFFQPDIFGISAGDGAQYGHPSYKVIQMLEQKYFPLKTKNNFMGRYSLLAHGLDYIAIQGEDQKLIKADEDQIPFLCPSLYGCIKWNQDGISTNFDNTLEYEDKTHRILYTTHAWECKAVPLKRLISNTTFIVSSTQTNCQNREMQFVSFPMKGKCNYYVFKMQGTEDFFIGIIVGDKIYFYRILEA